MTERARFPHATYRLQLNKDFTFTHARALVPYLRELGVSHAYLSPILKARPGSTHGYDTVDHRQINPELGTLEDFRALALTLREAGLGIVLDFVPNHMGVGGADNALWLDVLKRGPGSWFADWFDIDWSRFGGQLLVPFLGMSFAEALDKGEVRLRADGEGFAVWAHGEHKLPIRAQDEAALIARYGDAAAAVQAHEGDEAALDALIGRQHWRLAHFSAAADEINYRRFFINSDLAGIRIEKPEVFEHAHELVFSLIGEGLVDGLRIDHVDGLVDPKGYLETLREKCPRPIYLVVEKILAPHEQVRATWPVEGTTGYEFGALLTRVLVNGEAEETLTRTYRRFAGDMADAQAQTYACKLRVMDHELAAELAALGRMVGALARSVPATRDLTENGLRKGLREIIAWLKVYRTYFDDGPDGEQDRREIGYAIAKARRAAAHYQPGIFDFLQRLFCRQLPADYDPAAVQEMITRFQQYSGPVMAKGLEDTALYRSNRLVALNEVGARPEIFSVGIEAFHDANRRRLAVEPFTMLTTSTHDTKRGEDTRGRIAAIADRPELWAEAAFEWRAILAADGAEGIDSNDVYLFFQLLLGAWPADASAVPSDLAERLQEAMVKSVREARVHSDWGVNNRAYEAAIRNFVGAALRNDAFLKRFGEVETALGAIGLRKGLIQTVLKLTAPGIPDIYRGAEMMEQSLVDPDNRRPVDFDMLRRELERVSARGKATGGALKLRLTTTLLRLRRRLPELFLAGAYRPIDMGGNKRWLGFSRSHEGAVLMVMADLSPGHKGVMREAVQLPGGGFEDLLTGELFAGEVKVSRSLEQYGAVVLLGEDRVGSELSSTKEPPSPLAGEGV